MIRVLMVDDEPLVRHGVVAGMDWAALGCEVVGEAQSGEEGLELARKLKPDLIITDIRMPKMDGITMMNTLREEGCAARCIVLTAHSDFEYARGALLFGADDYLLKPFRRRRSRKRPAMSVRRWITSRGIMPTRTFLSRPSPSICASARGIFPMCSRSRRA